VGFGLEHGSPLLIIINSWRNLKNLSLGAPKDHPKTLKWIKIYCAKFTQKNNSSSIKKKSYNFFVSQLHKNIIFFSYETIPALERKCIHVILKDVDFEICNPDLVPNFYDPKKLNTEIMENWQ